jgi:hypothetical protein
MLPAAFTAQDRQACQVKHIQNRGIAELVTEGKAYHIEISQRAPGLQAVEGEVILPQQFLHIRPGSVNTLGLDPGHGIHLPIKDRYGHVGHADFVDVGEGQRDMQIGVSPAAGNSVPLAAGIAGGLDYLI